MLVPASAGAQQQISTSFQELSGQLEPGDTLIVTDVNGRKTKGELGTLTPSSLELIVRKTEADGRETRVRLAPLLERDVRRIVLEEPDSVVNGALIGLAAGARVSLRF